MSTWWGDFQWSIKFSWSPINRFRCVATVTLNKKLNVFCYTYFKIIFKKNKSTFFFYSCNEKLANNFKNGVN